MGAQKNTIRLDKLLSSLGVCSRRSVADFLKENKVMVDGKKAVNPGQRALAKCKIKINGKEITKPKLVYYVLNKPKGYISTAKDEFGRKNVLSLVKSRERIFPIGRLDKNTHGLLILTNDGDLTNKLIHPKHNVGKVYELKIRGKVTNLKVKKFSDGVMLEDGMTSPAKVKIVAADKNTTILKVEINEGRKRQIRRVCEVLKLELLDLKRTKFGKLSLGNLKLGDFRKLSKTEISALKNY